MFILIIKMEKSFNDQCVTKVQLNSLLHRASILILVTNKQETH